jgi:predicted PolB exonuclease-like 3'-5' exonuclease
MFNQDYFSTLLFFDIETCGEYPDYEAFKKADPDGAKIYEGKCQRMGYGEPEVGYSNKVSLFPEFGRIVCLSYGIWKNGEITISTVSDDDEKEMLKKIAALFHKAGARGMIPCGWNIKNFDLSWIYRKMLMHGLQVPDVINSFGKKPWEINILDLKEWWKGFSNLDVTFEEASYAIGLPSPKDEMHGGQVHLNYHFKNNKAGVIQYCEKDVKTMILMVERISKIYGSSVEQNILA